MCEVPATVNVYTTQFSLSDGVVQIFPNNPPGSLLNVSITNREQIARSGRISNEKQSTKFKENCSYPNTKFYLVTSLEIWNKKKRRVI